MFNRLKNWLNPKPERRTLEGDILGITRAPTRSGVTVTEATALGISALRCGVQVITEAVGSLPLILYRKDDTGNRSRAVDHPLYSILHDEPNPDMTAPVFREAMMFSAILHGNAYAEIVRDNSGQPLELVPIDAGRVEGKYSSTGRLQYHVDGGTDPLNAEDVIHVPGLQSGSGVGLSLLSLARETLGYSIAASQFGASWFGNAARPSGVLETAGQLSDPARANLAKSWATLHSGPDNAGKVAILEEGLKFQPFGSTNEQSQYTEVLTFLVGEVARLLNISPAKLHELQGTSQYGTLEAIQADFYATTLRPWLVKFESEYNRKLLFRHERGQLYCEHLVDAILRADQSTRFANYATAIQAGFMTVAEVRERENMPPMEDNGSTPTQLAV